MKTNAFLLLCFIGLFSFSNFAISQNTEWTVGISSIKFKIKNAGFVVDGTFNGLATKIIFNESKNYGNSIDATIDAKSVNTSNSKRDTHLQKAEYFDVDKYPKINLKAVLFTKQQDGSYKGFFKLTIKNATKDVVIPFTFKELDGKGVFKGAFTINRLDFGVGESSMILSNIVSISIEINATKK